MPLSRSRDYLSIGEVLEQVRGDFPDVSISKIRFLESEGLIAPQRTASGYRKFYESDVRRLRRILALQRDHFMPLRVIRERLQAGDDPPEPVATHRDGVPDGRTAPSRPTPTPAGSDVQLNVEELQDAAGLSDPELSELYEYGLIEQNAWYDADDLAVAKAAAGLFRYGIEARHLRMYRQFVDREMGVLQPLVSPLAQRKDERGAHEARDSAQTLLELTRRLHDGLIRARVREVLRSPSR